VSEPREIEQPRTLRLAQGILLLWLVLGVFGAIAPHAPLLLRGMASDLLALLAVLVLAIAVGVPLGAVAGSGPRWADTALAFTTDWVATVPVVLLLAFLRPAGVGAAGNLLLLGLLRALEVGWVVRSALLRGAALDTTWAARSLGYMPLRIFVNHRLPAAVDPAIAHLALTPIWTFLLDSVGSAAGLGAASSERSLGALLARPDGSVSSAALAILAVVSLTWALHRAGAHYGLRLVRK
jgi:ABC-type dipeptide/oligopeptide/nickel transport system permease subunit